MRKKAKSDAVKFVYYFASSTDGFVADARGGVGWLDAYDSVDYGFTAFMKGIDGMVMGRKTYEQVLGFGKWHYHGTPCVVLSKSRQQGPYVTFWHDPVTGLREHFQNQGAKRVWMVGGGAAAAAFLNADMIDEVEQHIIPIVLGTGIPAYGPLYKNVPFRLTESKVFENGVVMVRYERKDGGKK